MSFGVQSGNMEYRWSYDQELSLPEFPEWWCIVLFCFQRTEKIKIKQEIREIIRKRNAELLPSFLVISALTCLLSESSPLREHCTNLAALRYSDHALKMKDYPILGFLSHVETRFSLVITNGTNFEVFWEMWIYCEMHVRLVVHAQTSSQQGYEPALNIAWPEQRPFSISARHCIFLEHGLRMLIIDLFFGNKAARDYCIYRSI